MKQHLDELLVVVLGLAVEPVGRSHNGTAQVPLIVGRHGSFQACQHLRSSSNSSQSLWHTRWVSSLHTITMPRIYVRTPQYRHACQFSVPGIICTLQIKQSQKISVHACRFVSLDSSVLCRSSRALCDPESALCQHQSLSVLSHLEDCH